MENQYYKPSLSFSLKVIIPLYTIIVVLGVLVMVPTLAKGKGTVSSGITLIEDSPQMPLLTSSGCGERKYRGNYSANGPIAGNITCGRQHGDLVALWGLSSGDIPGGVSKQVNTSLISPGGTLFYTITVGNDAASPVTYTITDTIPQYSTYLDGSASNGLYYDGLENQLTASVSLTGTKFEIQPAQFLTDYISLAALGVSPYPCPDVECHHASMLLGGINFMFNGEPVRSVLWHTDGFLGINYTSVLTETHNQNFPDPTTPNNVIAPLWADFDLDGGVGDTSGGGNLYYARVSDGTYDYSVFEWRNAQVSNQPTSSCSFQVWFREGTSDLWFVYDTISGTLATASVGAENYDGKAGAIYFYNGNGTLPGKGTRLKIVVDAETAQFTFRAKATFLTGKTITNIVEVGNSCNSQTITSSVYTITDGYHQYLPMLEK